MDHGQERVSATKQLECFRNVPGNDNVMPRARQCLRYAFEKRNVRPYDKYRCHDVLELHLREKQTIALSMPLQHSQHGTLKKSDQEIRNDRSDVYRADTRNDLAERLEQRLAHGI